MELSRAGKAGHNKLGLFDYEDKKMIRSKK
jgi:hypothetical protein